MGLSEPPAQQHSAASREAAVAIKPFQRSLKKKVYDYLERFGPATDEQIQYALSMDPSTERPRRVELVADGKVIKVGEGRTSSGRKAALWDLHPNERRLF